MNRKFKEQHLFHICNIINVFTVIFDPFKVSLQNKSINFPQHFVQ